MIVSTLQVPLSDLRRSCHTLSSDHILRDAMILYSTQEDISWPPRSSNPAGDGRTRRGLMGCNLTEVGIFFFLNFFLEDQKPSVRFGMDCVFLILRTWSKRRRKQRLRSRICTTSQSLQHLEHVADYALLATSEYSRSPLRANVSDFHDLAFRRLLSSQHLPLRMALKRARGCAIGTNLLLCKSAALHRTD